MKLLNITSDYLVSLIWFFIDFGLYLIIYQKQSKWRSKSNSDQNLVNISFFLGNRTKPFCRWAYFRAFFKKYCFLAILLCFDHWAIHFCWVQILFIIVFTSHQLIHKSITSFYYLRYFLYLSFFHFIIEHLLILTILQSYHFLVWSSDVEFLCWRTLQRSRNTNNTLILLLLLSRCFNLRFFIFNFFQQFLFISEALCRFLFFSFFLTL